MYKKTLDKVARYTENNKSKSENKFIKEITKIKSISDEEKVELINRIKNGDTSANKDLIYYSLKDVLAVAINYCDENINLIDLIEEGCFHVTEIAKSINLNKYKYQTYFRTQMISILDYHKNKYYENFEQIKHGHIQDYKNTTKAFYDLSDNILLKYDLKNLLDKVNLSNRELLVFNLQFYYNLNSAEIARKLNISRQSVNETYINAINKMVSSRHTDYLINYMDNPEEAKQKLLIRREKILNKRKNK